MQKLNFKPAVFSLLLAGVSAITPALADSFKHETRYTIRYGAIELGRATFKIDYDGKSYRLNGSGGTTGLVEWLAPSTGSVESKGAVRRGELKPVHHFVEVREKKKKAETVKLAFARNKVVDVKIQSNKKRKVRKAPRYVPVKARHLSAVMDPASSMIVPVDAGDANNGHKVCNQRFPVFDGETRYDIQLKYKYVKRIKTGGYDGNAFVCQMRYIPVAGHKKDHRQVKEMAANKRMEIWLAPMQKQNVFTAIQIVVGTKYGTFLAKPTYFGAQG